MTHQAVLVLLLPASIAMAAGDERPAGRESERLLAEGRHLILEVNCNDCYGKSEEGLREGIRKVEEALRLGVPDRGEACRLLFRAYWDISFLGGGERDESALRKSREGLACAIADEPDNPEWLFDYATYFGQGENQEGLYKKILEVAPDHPGALFELGRLEVEKGQIEEGTQRMLRAFWLADGAQAVDMGERLLGQKLDEVGLEKERILVENRVEELRKKSF